MVKIRLVGSKTYALGGEQFVKGNIYGLSEDKAATLLAKTDDYGQPYFVKAEESTPAERKAKARKAKVKTDLPSLPAGGPVVGKVDESDDGEPGTDSADGAIKV